MPKVSDGGKSGTFHFEKKVLNPLVILTAPTVGRVSDLLDDNGELTLFWLDAREEPWNCPGRIYLFGKALVPGTTDKFVSCCVLVNNMERNLYVLPRSYHVQGQFNTIRSPYLSLNLIANPDPRFPKETQTDEAVGIKDVYNEIRGACSKLGIRKWKSKVATRKYAFENEDGDIPAETQYLKLVYSAECMSTHAILCMCILCK